MRRPGGELLAARQRVLLLRERPLAPVDPAVGAEVRAVQVVGAAGERLAVEPHLLLVGLAVAVGVGELEDLRRGGDVERPVQPHRPFGEHHVRHEHRRLVVLPVAAGVFEADDAVRLRLDLLGDLLVGPGRVADVEPALLVERGDDRPLDLRRSGDQFDGEPVGQGERVAVELDLVIPGGRIGLRRAGGVSPR